LTSTANFFRLPLESLSPATLITMSPALVVGPIGPTTENDPILSELTTLISVGPANNSRDAFPALMVSKLYVPPVNTTVPLRRTLSS
jgi:hypothetical protein